MPIPAIPPIPPIKNHAALSNLTWATSGHTIDSNVNYNKFMAIAMCCDNGTTFPSTPNEGQWFKHTPTGRSILYQYSTLTASWVPIMSFGAMTVYVDKTNGTDSQDIGFGTGANAYKTIQYAVNQIPGLVGGNVFIYQSAGTYAEFVNIFGKNFTGPYSITIQGEWNQLLGTTTVSSATAGSNTAHATLTVTGAGWVTDTFKNKWLVFSSNTPTIALRDKIYLIQSNTATTLTVIGTFDSGVPSSSDIFTIQGQGAVISGGPAITVTQGQRGVKVKNIKSSDQQGFLVQSGSEAIFMNCDSPTVQAIRFSAVSVDTCYLHGANNQSRNLYSEQGSLVQYGRCMIDGENLSYYCIDVADNSIAFSQGATLYYNTTNVIQRGTIGLHVSANGSTVNYLNGGTQTATDIKNCTTGILAETGGQATYTGTTYIKFTSNTTNTNAVAATYGCIT